jgi:hypothetical protein
MRVWPIWELATLGFLAIGAPLAGFAWWRGWYRAGRVIVAVGIGCAGVAAASQPSHPLWLAIAAFTFLYATATSRWLRLLCSRLWVAVRLTLAKLPQSKSIQAAPLLFCGPLAASAWIGFGHQSSSIPVRSAIDTSDPAVMAFEAHTDCGRLVPLYAVRADADEDGSLFKLEEPLQKRYPFSLLRTAPPDPSSDCHGWVFTGGRFFIQSDMVDLILADNGYVETARPSPGDLIVYRGTSGQVNHTGIVRLANERDVTIESKWGSLGRYLHQPENQPYDDRWTYCRSPRSGHLLHIDESPSSAPLPAE